MRSSTKDRSIHVRLETYVSRANVLPYCSYVHAGYCECVGVLAYYLYMQVAFVCKVSVYGCTY